MEGCALTDLVSCQRVDEALRALLESFRIPGEAQKIERVMEAFAEAYFEQPSASPRAFASRDAVFVFAFSVVMLHTDAHTASLNDDQRMTLDQFVRNNRGINDNADLPRELLEQVWTSVRQQEFLVMCVCVCARAQRADFAQV
jgi:Sec7-like guanine-nucleotide exchange factor